MSLVSTFSLKLREKLYTSYNYTITFIQKKNIENKFYDKLSDFFNYLWLQNKGIFESEVLKDLPQSLVKDILFHKYFKNFQNSKIFLDSENKPNIPLLRSMLAIIKIKYHLIGDVITTVGDINYNIYFILDGKVDIISNDGKEVVASLKSGNYFGESNLLLDNPIRTASVLCTQISQIGIMTRKNIEILFNAYPEFHTNMVKFTMQ